MLAGLIVGACIVYTIGWYYLADRFDARAEAAIASFNSNGKEAICAERTIRGYPFRIGIFCDDVAFADADEGLAFSAGSFRSAGQIYNPRFLVGELDGPAHLSLPRGLPALALEWDILRASIRLSAPLPERLSVESRNFRAKAAAGDLSGATLLRADRAEAHMRPNGADLDLAASVTGVALDQTLALGRPFPPISGNADLSIDNGAALVASGAATLRGQSGTIRKLTLAPGADTAVTVEGPLSIGSDGLIDADLRIAIRNPQALSAILVEALPELANQIRTAFSGIAALGETGGQVPPLPVRIVKGKVSIGFLTVAQIPPL
jgi:hypothetical protein